MGTAAALLFLAGIWTGQIPGRNGVMQDIAFQFTQENGKLGGKLYGDYQSSPISEAVVHGDLVTFVVVTQEQAGNQINTSRLRFSGRIVGEELELFRERESSTNAGNAGGVQLRDSGKQSFRLKRMIPASKSQ
ncbi:MAG: hypothetical protein FJW20_01545 [Acidimicrobiia bacterium]|nr:hypothetical protein [Acidimicrobiia bacterium]